MYRFSSVYLIKNKVKFIYWEILPFCVVNLTTIHHGVALKTSLISAMGVGI